MTRPSLSLALLATGLFPHVAHAACDPSPDITVCDSGCDTNSLSSAVGSATDGQIICIEGNYTHTGGALSVGGGRTITVQHDGVGTATVRRGNGNNVTVPSDSTLIISDVVFDGVNGNSSTRGMDLDGAVIGTNLTIEHYDTNSSNDGAGVNVDGSNASFHCTGCTLDDNSTDDEGGHLRAINGGDITLIDCTVTGGRARHSGGMEISGSGSTLTIIDSTFEDNEAEEEGGLMRVRDGATVDIDNSDFINNRTNSGSGKGGGVFWLENSGSNVTAHSSLFCNNSAKESGAVASLRSTGTSFTAQGSIFLENDSNDKGGVFHTETGATFTVTQNTFVLNDASSDGEALFASGGSGTFHSNVVVDHNNEAFYQSGGSYSFDYNAFFDNGSDYGGGASGGANDITLDPGFTYTASSCDPALVRHPSDSPVIGEGEGGTAIGAFDGPEAFDRDLDGDTFGADEDCDETDPTVNPGAVDIPSDGIDNDCNGADYEDLDGDGYEAGVDCDDTDPLVNPLGVEVPADGIDQDCDGYDHCYEDSDRDGYGSTTFYGSDTLDCLGAGYSPNNLDCDDTGGMGGPGSLINPDGTEVAGDGIDQDCDGFDECYIDSDNDGFGVGTTTGPDLTCDDETGLASQGGDCDDGNNDRFPGNPEITADGVDQDCDGEEICYADGDNDGFGDGTVVSPNQSCGDAGEATQEGDCDDGDNSVNPDGTELIADEIDSNCDGQELCYFDNDNDGYGAATTTISSDTDCQDNQEATNNEDCGDGNASINPDGTDIPGNTLDEDCNGYLMCWLDMDGDGSFGDTYSGESPTLTCSTGAGYAFDANVDDCDDDNSDRYPGNPEDVADGVDQNCDLQELCFVDSDLDGYGADDGSTVLSYNLSCSDSGQSTNELDCDDSIDTINPDGTDIAGNAVDEDCNGRFTCWLDNDNDGAFGDQFSGQSGNLDCDTGAGFAFDGDVTDCDDGNNDRYPGNPERVADGIDQDCDTLELCYIDGDTDGYGNDGAVTATSATLNCTASGFSDEATDCNDADPDVRPDAVELELDFVDQNCDNQELCAQDNDGDSYGSSIQPPVLSPLGAIDCDAAGVAPNRLDCDDGISTINPDGVEEVADDTDQDCNGEELCYLDADSDTYGSDTVIVPSLAIDCNGVSLIDGQDVADRGGDCLDSDDSYYPGAPEIPGDGQDQDCSGTDLVDCYEDLDGDGVGTTNTIPDPTGTCLSAGFSLSSNDCDDGMSDVYPGAPDDCDGVDNDCSEVINLTPCAGDDDWDGDGLCADQINDRGTVTADDDLDSEYLYGTDDCILDSDGDGWEDGEEARDAFGLDPASADTDGDGVDDGDEWPRVTVPTDSPKPDLDADGIPDVVDEDDDGDGFLSVIEGDRSVDTDNDNIPDREDIDDDGDGVLSRDELDEDTDGDGRPNRIDTDDDGDGWETLIENLLGAFYLSPDSDGDSRLDRDEGDWMGEVPVLGTPVDCAQLALDTDPNHVTIQGPEYWVFDFDGDGLHDLVDLDDDGDGHLTLVEGTDDLDGDGCPNSLDLDSDGDGKLDATEGSADADKDGISDLFDSDDTDGGLVDSDGDLVLTIDERPEKNGTLSLDPDTSCAESFRFENPGAYDAEIMAACDFAGTGDEAVLTDRGDLAIDGLELGGPTGYDPIDTDGDGIVDFRDNDDDNDGIPTSAEVGFGCDSGRQASIIKLTVEGTTAAWLQCLDLKLGDATFHKLSLSGTPGVDEVFYVDTDGDGLLDFQDPDDDGDGVPTAEEVASGGLGNDRDGDGIPDHLDTWDEDGPTGDADADGIPRDVEEYFGLNPFDDDSDGDGVRDDEEFGDDLSNPRDSDGDGIIDALDDDDDGDGVPTIDELRSDTDGDGDPDYLDFDSDGDGVDDADEFGLDDDCDGDPDHIDAQANEGLCDQKAFDPGYYERQACTCGTATHAGWLGWLGAGLGWLVRRR